MRLWLTVVSILVFFFTLPAPPASIADLYKYTDGKGTVHFTNELEYVPKKYRKKVTVIKEEEEKPVAALDNTSTVVRHEVQPEVPAEEAEEKEPDHKTIAAAVDVSFFDNIYIKISVFFFIGGAVIYLTGLFLNKYVKNRAANRLVLFLLAGIFSIYLFRLYAQDMQRRYNDVAEKVKDVQKGLEQKQYKNVQEADEIFKGTEGADK